MSMEVMQSVFGQDYFPMRAVDDPSPVPRVHGAAIQMAVWCGPGGPGPDTVHHDGDWSGCEDVHSGRLVSSLNRDNRAASLYRFIL